VFAELPDQPPAGAADRSATSRTRQRVRRARAEPSGHADSDAVAETTSEVGSSSRAAGANVGNAAPTAHSAQSEAGPPAQGTEQDVDRGDAADGEPDAPRLIMMPGQPVLGPITTADELTEAVDRLRAGTGPIAVDAERASGYRYSQRAYLVQLARSGSGIILIDPIAYPDLGAVQDAIGDVEWVLHAASQDLSCLREVGLDPVSLFDTETAGRLLGLERVSLASMLERFLDVTLEKGHSAADWSQRPLPADWLVYAALDVDLLLELRDAVAVELDRVGKTAWAEQEWAATLAAAPTGPRTDPWRRTSGIHGVRSRRQLAAVRSLWTARDAYARARDTAPGRVLPDAAIVAAVRANPESAEALSQLPVFRGPRQRQNAARWFGALAEAAALPETALPPAAAGSRDGMPAPTRWRERDPAAAERLQAVRAAVSAVAVAREVQSQNLLAADVMRRLCWTPPSPADRDGVATALLHLGARPWQIELCAAPISAALTPEPPPPAD
jgi:ribonuclease D